MDNLCFLCSTLCIKLHIGNSLQRHHNTRDGVSNHQHHDCSLDCLFRRRSKKTLKLRGSGLCAWNSVNSPHKSPVTWKMFPFDDVIIRNFMQCNWRHAELQYIIIIMHHFNDYPANNLATIRIIVLSLANKNIQFDLSLTFCSLIYMFLFKCSFMVKNWKNIHRSDRQATFELYRSYQVFTGPVSHITFTKYCLIQWLCKKSNAIQESCI